MAYLEDGYITETPAARAVPSERVLFLQRTYGHLAGAILAFIGLEYALLSTPIGESIVRSLVSSGTVGMIALMVAFIGAGYMARSMARSSTSRAMQYGGLALYVVVEAIIFVPILMLAQWKTGDASLIQKAGLLTGALFLGLSTAVIMTKADFSWLGTGLCVLGWVALATVIIGAIFGFSLGLWFSVVMIALAGGYIVYDTSMILHHYPTNAYVSASLELFASVALLFYYILRFAIQMSGNSRD